MPGNEINTVKTKLRSTCKKYFIINLPHTQTKIIKKKKKSDDIILLKQYKGRGGVLMD